MFVLVLVQFAAKSSVGVFFSHFLRKRKALGALIASSRGITLRASKHTGHIYCLFGFRTHVVLLVGVTRFVSVSHFPSPSSCILITSSFPLSKSSLTLFPFVFRLYTHLSEVLRLGSNCRSLFCLLKSRQVEIVRGGWISKKEVPRRQNDMI